MGKLKFAFMGFRHGHIMAAYNLVKTRTDAEIVAACEEDDATRKKLLADGKVAITHSDFQTMLDQAPCDIIAVGDYYGKRGSIIIRALKQGKHVISDKPICTSLAELDEIRALASRQRLVVSCQFDLRDTGLFREMRRLIRSGEIGEVHAISFNGQHPLNYGIRPGWYFEEGKQGGTLNDIAVHAMDALPWLTGLQFRTINAARHWNACLKQVPFFKDAAQVMMTMNNGCGVLGDVSYLAPDGIGYSLPQYWRMTFWGEKGVIENNYVSKTFTLYKRNGEKGGCHFANLADCPGGYLESFLQEIRGQSQELLHLSSAEVLQASRIALLVQHAADQQLMNVAIP